MGFKVIPLNSCELKIVLLSMTINAIGGSQDKVTRSATVALQLLALSSAPGYLYRDIEIRYLNFSLDKVNYSLILLIFLILYLMFLNNSLFKKKFKLFIKIH